MVSDDVGQQRLQAAEQRLAPAGGHPASATRVEVAQPGQDEEMTETSDPIGRDEPFHRRGSWALCLRNLDLRILDLFQRRM